MEKTAYSFVSLKKRVYKNGIARIYHIDLMICKNRNGKNVTIFTDTYYIKGDTVKSQHIVNRFDGAGYRFALQYAKGCKDGYEITL